MNTVVVGVKLPFDTVAQIDRMVIQGQALNRSDATRILIREALRNREAAA